jgi:hypothetical protein
MSSRFSSEQRSVYFNDEYRKAVTTLIEGRNYSLRPNLILRKFEAFQRAQTQWEEAYKGIILPEGEPFIRYSIAVKTLMILRKCRQRLNGPLTEEERTSLFERIHSLVIKIPEQFLSSDEMEEPSELLSLEAELGEILPAALVQNIFTVTTHLPMHISEALSNQSVEDLLLEIFAANNIHEDISRVIEEVKGKRLLIVSGLSSGAMRIPFLIEAAKKAGIKDIFLEVHSPVVRPSNAENRYELTELNIMPKPMNPIPEIIWVLDDTISNGDTLRVLVSSTRARYGENVRIISGI